MFGKSYLLKEKKKQTLKVQEEVFLMLNLTVSQLVWPHTRAMYSYTVLGTDVIRMCVCMRMWVCLKNFGGFILIYLFFKIYGSQIE